MRKRIKLRPVYRKPRKLKFGIKEGVGLGIGLTALGMGIKSYKESTA